MRVHRFIMGAFFGDTTPTDQEYERFLIDHCEVVEFRELLYFSEEITEILIRMTFDMTPDDAIEHLQYAINSYSGYPNMVIPEDGVLDFRTYHWLGVIVRKPGGICFICEHLNSV